MYNLYLDEKTRAIVIQNVTKKRVKLSTNYTSEVTRFNNNYYVSTDIQALKNKAIEIKNKWILELENELLLVNRIKI